MATKTTTQATNDKTHEVTNEALASLLEQITDMLDAQDANPSRIEAYRRGAGTIREHAESIAEMIQAERFNDITAIPTIGGGITSVLTEYVVDGRSKLLNDLQAKLSPVQQFERVEGMDTETATRLHDELHLQNLDDLEDAAYDGRLAELDGFDAKRIKSIKQSAAELLGRPAQADDAETREQDERPPVDVLLELDEEYRRRADAGELTNVSPRTFNPNNEAWLPVMKTERDGWHFTVLYSNTEQAHKLGRTHDWVVIYHERNGHERQHTVVNEFKGSLTGKRVVRGRDAENQKHYESETAKSRE